MKKLLFVLCLGMVGIGYAVLKDSVGPCIDKNGNGVPCTSKEAVLIFKSHVPELSLVIVCHHEWEKSEYFLEHRYTEEELSCAALLMTNCAHTVQPVEVCKNCGLLRINPKDRR